jgi:hypothetical protein
MASLVALAVNGFMVAPSVSLTIAVLLRRWWWWYLSCFWGKELRIGVEGFISLRFINVVILVLPHYLDNQPFKGIGLPKVHHQFILEVFDLIELLVGLLDGFVEAGGFVS